MIRFDSILTHKFSVRFDSIQFKIDYFGYISGTVHVGLGDISHAICMRISSVKPAP